MRTKATAEDCAGEQLPPMVALLQMSIASWVQRAIHVAAKLGIADRLAEGPQHTETLARATQSNEPALYRLMRALASVGIFRELEAHVFVLTPMAEYLRSLAPQSQRPLAIMVGESWHSKLVGAMAYTVETGRPAFDHIFGMSQFEFLERDVAAGELFDEAMTSFSAAEIPAVLDAYDFSRFERVIDVGSGHGSLIAALLNRVSTLRATLYDRAEVARGAIPLVANAKLATRCDVISGDFFTSVPRGGDAYLLKHILHDWDDEKCLTILQRCHEAAAPGKTLLAIEMVIPEGNDACVGKLLDLEMMLIGGRERTESEYRALFDAAGFRLNKVVPTAAPVSVIEAIRLE